MTDAKKLQIPVVVDGSGAKQGFQEVKDAAKDMAQSVSQAGQEAAKGLDNVGTGAGASAQKVDRATSSLIGSIQRTTAAMEAGSKSSADYYRVLAQQRGISADALKPYLDQLDAAQAKTRAAATATADLQRITTSLGASSFSKPNSALTTSLGATDFKVNLDSVGTSLGAAPIKAATEALKPYNEQLEIAATKVKTLSAASRDLSGVTTSLGASSFSKPIGNPTTSLGATSFGAKASDLKPAAEGVDAYTKSVKQLAMQHQIAAVQVKDFFEQIVSGGNPLRAFAQQGAAVVSNYGGFGNTLKALGGLITPLAAGIGIAAAAVGSLGIAFYQGAKETTEYNKALILTGNYLGLTVSQLQTYATTISKTVGTQGAAAEALTALANSGKVAKESLTSVGTAVVLMNRVLGTSVDEATATFVKLADEPTKASVKLNESMHYLNLATYERIRALEDQGDKEAAAALAQDTYATESTARLKKIEAGAGTLEKQWRELADWAKEAWNQMLGLGREKSIGDALGEAQGKLNEARAQAARGGAYATLYGPSIKKGEEDVAALNRSAMNAQEKAIAEGEKTRAESAKIGASGRLKTLSDEVQTNADKRRRAIEQLDKDFKTLGSDAAIRAGDGKTYDQQLANINKKFPDPKGASEKAYTDDAATRMLETLRQTEASLKEQLSTDDKLTASEKERAKFVQMIADLKGKKQLTDDQKSLLANQDAIKAQLDKNVAVEKEIVLKQQVAKLAEQQLSFEKQMQGITLSYKSANDNRSEQYDRTLSTVGLGTRARQEVEAQKSIRKEYDRYVLQANKEAANASKDGFDAFGTEAYKQQIADIQQAREAELDKQKQFFAAEKDARENWVNGAKEAFANYADEASNAASHAQEAFGNLFKGLEDQFTNLFTGKKFDVKALLSQAEGDFARNFVKEKITGPLAELAGQSLGDGGFLAGIFGSGTKAGSASSRGASAGNPLYVRLADGGIGGALSAGGAQGGAGGLDWAGALGKAAGAFGGLSNSFATSAANALPGNSLDNLIKLQGGWGTVAGFANGGDLPPGRVSIVGERGPELVVSRGANTVIPNHALGGGTTVHINQTFSEGTTRKTADQAAMAASNAIRRAQRNA